MDTKGDPALRDAAAVGDEAELAMFLWRSDAGLHIDAAYAFGCTALWLASANGHHGCAMLLIEGGADANAAAADGTTPFAVACKNGHKDVARLLAEYARTLAAQCHASAGC